MDLKIKFSRVYIGPNFHIDTPAVYFAFKISGFKKIPTEDFDLNFDAKHIVSLLLAWAGISLNTENFMALSGLDTPEQKVMEVIRQILMAMLDEIGETVEFLEIRPGQEAENFDILYSCDDLEAGYRTGRLALQLSKALIMQIAGDGKRIDIDFAEKKNTLSVLQGKGGTPLPTELF